MVTVHALVTEVFADLVDTLEAAYDESLQIKLGRDTHVHVGVERVEMGDERTCAGTACNGLQCGCLHLRVASLVEHAAQGAQHGSTLEEGVFHAVIDDEVDITLAVAQLGIIKLVVCHAVLILNDRQRLEAL